MLLYTFVPYPDQITSDQIATSLNYVLQSSCAVWKGYYTSLASSLKDKKVNMSDKINHTYGMSNGQWNHKYENKIA